jgi:predicted dehydrogenase
MKQDMIIAGFIGAGGIARSHAYSINSLKYYYNEIPEIELAAVCSARKESRESFAKQYGFAKACDLSEFISDNKINSVYILGPNKVHYEHLKSALSMPSVERIYIEKPVCSSIREEESIRLLASEYPDKKIQVGFQYLYSSSVREALAFWQSGKLGQPVHFDLKYFHSDYLKKEYRDKRSNRLTPAPDGGAMADLGSHIISMLIAFLGKSIEITGATQSGHFDDVPAGSDLFSQIMLHDKASGAVGSISASRISSGTGDDIFFEIYAEKGALRYSSATADYFEYYTEESGTWTRKMVGSNYKPVTSFPSDHVPPGWLRAMVHAHYVFLTGSRSELIVPDIEHGLDVQRIVRETAGHLNTFRNSTGK